MPTWRPGAQVVATLALVAYTMMAVLGASGPAAIVLGGGLALSSTAVAMQARSPRAPGAQSLRAQASRVCPLLCSWLHLRQQRCSTGVVIILCSTCHEWRGCACFGMLTAPCCAPVPGAARPCGDGLSSRPRHLCRAPLPGGAPRL